MDNINSEFFTEILEQNKDSVRKAVAEAMLDGVKRQCEWELPETVKTEIQVFIQNEVVPEVRKELMSNKSAIVDAATTMIASVPAEIGTAMQTHIAKNLADSWKLKQVIEALM